MPKEMKSRSHGFSHGKTSKPKRTYKKPSVLSKGFGGEPSEFTSKVPFKYGIIGISVIAIILISSFAYYQNNVAYSGGILLNNKDPFTTLWNGEIPSSFSTSSGSSGSIAFSNKVNATCLVSCGGAPVDTVLTFPSLTTGSGDTIIIEWWGSHAIVAKFSVTDSSLNPYTSRLNVTSQVNGLDIYFASAPSSTTGSLVVTLKSTAQNSFAGFVSDYSGAIGFGNTASNIGNTGGGTSGTSSITITSSATSSFILEFISVVEGSGTYSITPSSSQTLRNRDFNGGSAGFDKTGLSGSQSLTLAFSGSSTPLVWTHGGLELTNSITSATTCGQVGYQCSNMKIVNGFLQANANASYPAIAITNSSIDLSTAVGKALAFNFQLVTNTPFVGEEFGFFLRTNGTLPNSLVLNNTGTGSIQDKTPFYSPTNDTNVALSVIVTVTSGKYNYYVYMNRNTGLNKIFTGTENPTIPCNQTFSLFLCANNSTTADSTFPIFPLVLNYTGSSTGATGGGQSYLCNDFGGGGTTCNLGGANNVALSITNTNFRSNYTEPWLNIQNRYFVGLWEKATSNPTIVKFKTATNQQSQIISIYSPNTSNSNTIEGGFFGWLGNSIGTTFNIAGRLLAPVISPIISIGSSLEGAFVSALIESVSLGATGLVQVLNLIGNFFHVGNIGSNVQSFLTGIGSWLVNVFGGSIGTLGSLASIAQNGVSIFVAFVTGSNQFLNLWTSLLGAWATVIGFLSQVVGWLAFGWVNVAVIIAFILTFDVALGALSAVLDMERNPLGFFIGTAMLGVLLLILKNSSTSINVIATNPTILTNYQTAINSTMFVGANMWFIQIVPFFTILLFFDWVLDGYDSTSAKNESGGGIGNWLPNWSAWLHFNLLSMTEIFKATFWLSKESWTIVLNIKEFVSGYL